MLASSSRTSRSRSLGRSVTATFNHSANAHATQPDATTTVARQTHRAGSNVPFQVPAHPCPPTLTEDTKCALPPILFPVLLAPALCAPCNLTALSLFAAPRPDCLEPLTQPYLYPSPYPAPTRRRLRLPLPSRAVYLAHGTSPAPMAPSPTCMPPPILSQSILLAAPRPDCLEPTES